MKKFILLLIIPFLIFGQDLVESKEKDWKDSIVSIKKEKVLIETRSRDFVKVTLDISYLYKPFFSEVEMVSFFGPEYKETKILSEIKYWVNDVINPYKAEELNSYNLNLIEGEILKRSAGSLSNFGKLNSFLILDIIVHNE